MQKQDHPTQAGPERKPELAQGDVAGMLRELLDNFGDRDVAANLALQAANKEVQRLPAARRALRDLQAAAVTLEGSGATEALSHAREAVAAIERGFFFLYPPGGAGVVQRFADALVAFISEGEALGTRAAASRILTLADGAFNAADAEQARARGDRRKARTLEERSGHHAVLKVSTIDGERRAFPGLAPELRAAFNRDALRKRRVRKGGDTR